MIAFEREERVEHGGVVTSSLWRVTADSPESILAVLEGMAEEKGLFPEMRADSEHAKSAAAMCSEDEVTR